MLLPEFDRLYRAYSAEDPFGHLTDVVCIPYHHSWCNDLTRFTHHTASHRKRQSGNMGAFPQSCCRRTSSVARIPFRFLTAPRRELAISRAPLRLPRPPFPLFADGLGVEAYKVVRRPPTLGIPATGRRTHSSRSATSRSCLWLGYGEIILSDAVLEALRKHGPRLSVLICFHKFRPHTSRGPLRLHPASVTLRSFHALSRKCPQLEVLHIPHLYVPPEDCYDTSNVDGAEHAPAHQLWKLLVCRAFIVDAHACALVLHRIFPHLDVDHCRAAYVQSHDACQEDHFFRAAWLNTLDALEGCQPPASHTAPSCCDSSQCDSSSP